MTVEAQKETLGFQTEVKQLLHLMIHSMYSNKEIFLRELISNASDACDKLRFAAIARPELLEGDADLRIELALDPQTGTLTVRDNGIGMTREEVISHLGTIARSGTRQFLESLTGEQKRDAALIGQFGVGFYSAFIVARRVSVLTRHAAGSEAVRWESDGEGEFSVEPADKPGRGTEVTLHLRDDEREFLEPLRLRGIVRKYSDHIGLPIIMANDKGEPETLNQARALWTRPKSELQDSDYQAFYQHIAHDWENPLAWAHHKVEGGLEYTSLLFIPARAPSDLWDREQARGVQLYVKRVFILDKASELLPPYLRFVRGLVDSSDLPLNVSRELLQGNRTVEKIKSALTRRVLDLLDELADKRPDDYVRFWQQFGAVLKEGLIEDHPNQARIARLCRFHSTTEAAQPVVSLADYLARMPEGQQKIYYLTGETLAAVKNSPHLEGFRKRGHEVLLLTDRVDEWVVEHLREYEGKPLESAARAGSEPESTVETPDKARLESEFKPVLTQLQEVLAGRIEAARVSARLTESPACLVAPERGLSRRMEDLLRQAGQKTPQSLPILEINPEHPLLARLREAADDTTRQDLAELVYAQAVLAEGGQLDDPPEFLRRLNRLLLGTEAPKSRLIV